MLQTITVMRNMLYNIKLKFWRWQNAYNEQVNEWRHVMLTWAMSDIIRKDLKK